MEARRALAEFVRSRPALWDLLHPPYHRARLLLNARRIRRAFGPRYVEGEAEGGAHLSRAIGAALAEGRPLAVGKIGGLEAELAGHYLRHRSGGDTAPYPPRLRAQAHLNVGLFPDDDASLDRFCAALLSAAGDTDILGTLGYAGEAEVVTRHAPRATLIAHRALDPWFSPDPWSRHLAGKRVFVVSPFAATIERQYARRTAIWPPRDDDAEILPAFHLRTVRMPLSPGLSPPAEPDWDTRMARIRDAMAAEPYDVLLVGAGGISLLLAAAARRAGRVGFHMGGPTQVLFGIRGKRWDDDPTFAPFMTGAWTRPEPGDTPPEVRRIEQGAYW